MKIIVVGLGETGKALIKLLDQTDHDVVVVDRNQDRVDDATDHYRVNGVVGSAASAQTLLKAGADTADVLVALTHADEINLLSCMQAKAAGTRICAARLLLPDLIGEEEALKEKYKIDFFVKPRLDLAEEVCKNIGLPGFVKVESYLDERIQVININATDDSVLIGKTVADVESMAGSMKVGALVRANKSETLKGDLAVKEDDSLYLVVKRENLETAFSSLGIKRDKVKDVVIVGGTNSAGYLAEKLLKDGKKLTLIDDDIERCKEKMDRFPTSSVLYAQGDISEVLEEEHVEKADAIVSLTDNDETNLVVSMFAWSKKIPSVITRVDKQVHVKLLHKVNIDITVSPTEISVFRILRFISETVHGDQDEEKAASGFVKLINQLRN